MLQFVLCFKQSYKQQRYSKERVMKVFIKEKKITWTIKVNQRC